MTRIAATKRGLTEVPLRFKSLLESLRIDPPLILLAASKKEFHDMWIE
jgi:hypothetical protein